MMQSPTDTYYYISISQVYFRNANLKPCEAWSSSLLALGRSPSCSCSLCPIHSKRDQYRNSKYIIV